MCMPIVAIASQPQVGFADPLIRQEFESAPREDDPPRLQDEAAAGDPERVLGVLLDQEDRHPLPGIRTPTLTPRRLPIN